MTEEKDKPDDETAEAAPSPEEQAKATRRRMIIGLGGTILVLVVVFWFIFTFIIDPEIVVDAFPGAEVSFAPDVKRQAIIDSWPADVDDGAARRDWGLNPQFGLNEAFNDYLVPRIRERYV